MEQITQKQWEARRQAILANRGEGELALAMYNPQTDRTVTMNVPEDCVSMPPQVQFEGYILPALQELGLSNVYASSKL